MAFIHCDHCRNPPALDNIYTEFGCDNDGGYHCVGCNPRSCRVAATTTQIYNLHCVSCTNPENCPSNSNGVHCRGCTLECVHEYRYHCETCMDSNCTAPERNLICFSCVISDDGCEYHDILDSVEQADWYLNYTTEENFDDELYCRIIDEGIQALTQILQTTQTN